MIAPRIFPDVSNDERYRLQFYKICVLTAEANDFEILFKGLSFHTIIFKYERLTDVKTFFISSCIRIHLASISVTHVKVRNQDDYFLIFNILSVF